MKRIARLAALFAALAWPALATQTPLTSAYVLNSSCSPPLTNCEVELTNLATTDVVSIDQEPRFILLNVSVTNPDAANTTSVTSVNLRLTRDSVDLGSAVILVPPGTNTVQAVMTLLGQALGSHTYKVYVATNRGPLTFQTDTYLGVFGLTQVVGGSLTIGSSPIASGTNGRVLFDDSGLVGEDAGMSYVKATDTLTVTNLTGTASLATALAANGANCAAGNAPLGVDASGAVETCTDVATQAELNTHGALTTAHGSVSTNTASTIVQRDASGDFAAGTITAALTGNAATATALAANGSNCTAGNYPLGVDASGVVESCTSFAGAVLPTHDSTIILYGSGDATKQVRFEVDGLTTGTTRVITVPDANITLVGTSATQTLTNKSIVASQLTGTVAVANGGTALTTGTSGGVLAFTAAGTLASSAALTNNSVVLSGRQQACHGAQSDRANSRHMRHLTLHRCAQPGHGGGHHGRHHRVGHLRGQLRCNVH
jgi:hypothetical protein